MPSCTTRISASPFPGFYDDVAALSRQERKALNSLPWKEKEFRKTVGAPGLCGEKGYTIVEQLWTRPTLELNGIWGGYTGEGAKTVIPSKASCEAFHAAGSESGSRENREARRTPYSQAAAEIGSLQI